MCTSWVAANNHCAFAFEITKAKGRPIGVALFHAVVVLAKHASAKVRAANPERVFDFRDALSQGQVQLFAPKAEINWQV